MAGGAQQLPTTPPLSPRPVRMTYQKENLSRKAFTALLATTPWLLSATVHVGAAWQPIPNARALGQRYSIHKAYHRGKGTPYGCMGKLRASPADVQQRTLPGRAQSGTCRRTSTAQQRSLGRPWIAPSPTAQHMPRMELVSCGEVPETKHNRANESPT